MKGLFQNKSLLVLLFTYGLVTLATEMLGPLYALFVEDLGGTLWHAGATWAVFSVVAGITTLLAGKFIDRAKSKSKVLAFGYGLTAVAFFLFTQVESLVALLLVQVIVGVAQAIYAPAFDTIYSAHLDKHKEGTEWGAWESIFYFSSAIGAFAGGFIAFQYGFTALFMVMAVFSAIAAIRIYMTPQKLLR